MSYEIVSECFLQQRFPTETQKLQVKYMDLLMMKTTNTESLHN